MDTTSFDAESELRATVRRLRKRLRWVQAIGVACPAVLVGLANSSLRDIPGAFALAAGLIAVGGMAMLAGFFLASKVSGLERTILNAAPRTLADHLKAGK